MGTIGTAKGPWRLHGDCGSNVRNLSFRILHFHCHARIISKKVYKPSTQNHYHNLFYRGHRDIVYVADIVRELLNSMSDAASCLDLQLRSKISDGMHTGTWPQ